MDEELEPEILSYREFRSREALLAWQRRRRAFESQSGRRKETRDGDAEVGFVNPPLARMRAPPPR
jgi:hypothetical protein